MAFLPERPEALDEIRPQEGQQFLPKQSLAELTALKLVIQDFAIAERRIQSILWVFDRYDTLYNFRVPVAFWEGTTVPRAHLGVPLVLEHVESLLPQVMNTLFLDDPPFLTRPHPGTSMQAARANTAVLRRQLDEADFREQFRLMSKSALLYGVGIGKWGWKEEVVARLRAVRKKAPARVPFGSGELTIESEESDQLEFLEEEFLQSGPFFQALDARDVFVDSGLRSPDIRFAKHVVHRMYMTIGELDALRDTEGFDIPSKETLVSFFFPPKEQPPNPRRTGSSPIFGSSLDLNTDFEQARKEEEVSIDPMSKPLEVLEYWTPTRCITVLQRKLVLRNGDNPFGVIPFVSSPFVDKLNSFYGIGVAELVGGEQRLQQGIINSRLDDLALLLNGMFIRVRGTNTPTQQIRMRPGGVIDTDTPEGVQALPRRPAIPEAFAEIEASDRRAQRRTSANDIAVQGVLGSQTSLTRTATGISTLAAGAGARLQYFMENLAGLTFIPTLEAFTEMNRTYLRPSDLRRILSEELGQIYEGEVMDVINGGFQFEILAASKLQARRAMAQSLPILLNTMTNEAILSALQRQGKTVDFEELMRMVYDVSGWPNLQSIVRNMTQEELAASAMSNPQVQRTLLDEQRAQTDFARESDLSERKVEAQAGRDVLRTILKGVGDDNQGRTARTSAAR